MKSIKERILKLVVSICIFCFLQNIQAQSKKELYFNYGVIVDFSLNTEEIEVIMALPLEIPFRQEIKKISFSHHPISIFENNGNKYASFPLKADSLQKILTINIEAILYKGGIKHASKNNIQEEKEDMKKYLKPERYIESEEYIIQQKASQLKRRKDKRTLRNIYRFLMNNITYTSYLNISIGSKKTLELQKGKCEDFADLLVALCRASGIPARKIYGFKAEWYTSFTHAWAEAYLDNIGWIPFEVIVGNEGRFRCMKNRYISFSRLKNDAVLGQGNYYNCRYKGEENFKDMLFVELHN